MNHSGFAANNSAESPQNFLALLFMPTLRGKGREDQQVTGIEDDQSGEKKITD
jgi:hypothetical protein